MNEPPDKAEQLGRAGERLWRTIEPKVREALRERDERIQSVPESDWSADQRVAVAALLNGFGIAQVARALDTSPVHAEEIVQSILKRSES